MQAIDPFDKIIWILLTNFIIIWSLHPQIKLRSIVLDISIGKTKIKDLIAPPCRVY